MITIALDAMGGDHGLSVTVPAALQTLKQHSAVKLILVGQQEAIEAELQRHKQTISEHLTIHHASEIVGMDEPPAQALRTKKDSSMRLAINLVKEGIAQATVSAGNTGALMATARFVLKTLPGIDRPAIITALPTMHDHVHVLDLGANVDCTPEQLLQFAVMGSILVSAVEGKPRPRVGLLNIGEEDIKGNESVKKTHELLRASSLNYAGFVEGDEIYTGDLDVVVCDGFVGNVMLKTSEGLAQMITHFIKQEFKRNLLTRLSAFVSLPVLQAFRKRVDPRRYNGATLIGLNGTVIKSHGGADVLAFEHAILGALAEVKNNVPERIGQELTAMAAKGVVV
ncbi:MAG: phosphate acyltransferase PlsX [Gammaproteobacteria bacterium]|nr:phosphate acyltransferase PlsX [Gammaproteobacteria bacterium]MDH3370694.1 phosphate acyltransferase PlsX [Gammaproteobacteria bacterium]MDH3405929.1 phosphate acyltransferase PlsX [Gammaproteobacteria bacterium]MDH5486271.1 phosphate acyltransferase PlsX [Gammaproteobacteria bacterium]